MLKRLENKLMMLKAVLNLLKQNNETLSTVPALAELVGKLETLIGEIESIRLLTESDRTGITAEKHLQQEALIDKAYELSSALYAMASGSNNKVLQGKVDYTESDLQNIRGNDLVSTCTSIVALVRENLPGLTTYGVSEEDITGLETLNSNFAQNLPANRVSVTERKAANEKLKGVFLRADALLNEQLDRMMVRFKNTSPDLYAAYNHARVIVHYGIRHEKGETDATSENR